MQSDRYYSNPTQVYWRTKALLNGRKISHKTEIREVNGWRLGAIIHVLRKKYDWPILAEYRGPKNIVFYRLARGTDRSKLRFPPSAQTLAKKGGDE